jgi:hypothetical protein
LIFIIPAIGLLTFILTWINFFQSSANNHVFAGDAENIHYPGLSAKSLQSHEFQKYIEALISKNLRLRNFFISVNSQLYYSLFKKSFAENSQIIVGKNNQLFEMGYITAYCQPRAMTDESHNQLVDWANKIKILSDYFNGRGQTFIYVMTPSKAEYMPTAIPDRFHCQNTGISTHINEIKKLLDARRVRYIDGPALMMDATRKYGISMFPQGGIHWNWLGSSLAANDILRAINADKKFKLPMLNFKYTLGKVDRHDSDDDLLALVKLMKPDLSYLVPKVDLIGHPAPGKPLTLAIIGGSFNENLIRVFQKSNSFSKIHFYFYMNTEKIFSASKNSAEMTSIYPLTEKDFNAILSADVVILEENSSLTISSHGQRFYSMMSNLAIDHKS